ncbi:MAG: hypothetical protein WA851_11110 [Xanthobacteraceae bacterium]
MIGIKENDFLAQGRAEETDDEDLFLSCRVDNAALVDERPAKRAGGCRAHRKMGGVLQQLVRDARPGAGVPQRPVHRDALWLTRSFSCHCER